MNALKEFIRDTDAPLLGALLAGVLYFVGLLVMVIVTVPMIFLLCVSALAVLFGIALLLKAWARS